MSTGVSSRALLLTKGRLARSQLPLSRSSSSIPSASPFIHPSIPVFSRHTQTILRRIHSSRRHYESSSLSHHHQQQQQQPWRLGLLHSASASTPSVLHLLQQQQRRHRSTSATSGPNPTAAAAAATGEDLLQQEQSQAQQPSSSSSSSTPSSPSPSEGKVERNMFLRFTERYEGVQGGVIFRGRIAQHLTQKFPVLAPLNNVLVMAPFAKWVLAITPLYGALHGLPEVWDIDLMQTGALCFTGLVWTYYCLLVRPTAWMLVAVNFVLLCVNGYHIYRRIRYDMTAHPELQDGTSEDEEDTGGIPAAVNP